MKPALSPRQYYVNSWAMETGISWDEANAIHSDPALSETREYHGHLVRISTRPLASKLPATGLVVAMRVPGRLPELTVTSSLRLMASFHEDLASMQPSDVLRRAADRFFAPVEVGILRKRLYFLEDVQSIDGEPLRRGLPPTVHLTGRPGSAIGAAQEFCLTSEMRGTDWYWLCVLVYALDVTKYRNHLATPTVRERKPPPSH